MLQRRGRDCARACCRRLATGMLRGAFSMSEPDCGSDVAAIRTKAARDIENYVIDGQKMWLTNGASANLVAIPVETDQGAIGLPEHDHFAGREVERHRLSLSGHGQARKDLAGSTDSVGVRVVLAGY